MRAQAARYRRRGALVRPRDVGAAGDEPIVCVHGVPTSSFLWRKVLGELDGEGLHGVAFDLPGLGLADRPRRFD